MRIFIALCSLFLLVACQPQIDPNATTSPTASVKEKIGIYQDATVYTGKTDYAFTIDGQTVLIEVSNIDSTAISKVPSNLTDPNADGLPGPNPILIGQQYKIEYDANNHINKISLIGAHDPSSPELPAIPENYSGLLSVGPTEESRAYLNLSSDLSAMLLIDYGKNEEKTAKYGRWTRSADGQIATVQLDRKDWSFLIKEDALILRTDQMGTGGLTLVNTGKENICDYVHQWLSGLSNTDGEVKVPVEEISHETPLENILRTEHAYLGLYGDLEIIFGVKENDIANTLRKNPTVAGVCDLVMHVDGEGH